jgi:hypothetical protein
MTFDLDSPAPQEKLARLIELTERYCVVLQTLRAGPTVSVSRRNKGEPGQPGASSNVRPATPVGNSGK